MLLVLAPGRPQPVRALAREVGVVNRRVEVEVGNVEVRNDRMHAARSLRCCATHLVQRRTGE